MDPLVPPVIGNPVGVQDAARAIEYNHRIAKRRRMDPEAVTVQVLVESSILEMQVLGQFAGVNVAPAWFEPALQTAIQNALGPALQNALGPAIQNALGPALQNALAPLQNSLNALNEQMNRLHIELMKASNKSVIHPTDPLSPLSGVNELRFPATFHDLRHLGNAACNAIIASYNIPGAFANLDARRRGIANFIGVIRY